MEHLSEFILNHWPLVLVSVILFVVILGYELKMYQTQRHQITPQEAVLFINHQNATIIDIRDPAQFNEGHIIDSMRVDKDEHNETKLKKFKEKPVLIVCQRGISSQEVAKSWTEAGFKHIQVLKGGIDAWREAGFPLVKSKS